MSTAFVYLSKSAIIEQREKRWFGLGGWNKAFRCEWDGNKLHQVKTEQKMKRFQFEFQLFHGVEENKIKGRRNRKASYMHLIHWICNSWKGVGVRGPNSHPPLLALQQRGWGCRRSRLLEIPTRCRPLGTAFMRHQPAELPLSFCSSASFCQRSP